MPSISLTTGQAGLQITGHGYSWTTEIGTPVTVTFGFRESAPLYHNSSHNEQNTFSQVSASEMAAFELALSLWSDVAGITFEAANPGGYTNNAVMLFANYNNPGDGAGGFAQYPLYQIPYPDSVEGDVWMQVGAAGSQPLGGYNFLAIMHEVGHAIGLEHPGDYAAVPGVVPTYNNNAVYVEDTRQYTIMSYFDAWITGARHYETYPAFALNPSTPMLHDIAAVQRLYGVNMSTRTGDTVYGFNSTADRAPFDFSTNADPVAAIWDAGGHDCLDVSGYSTNQVINLLAEAFSDVGKLTKNVAIAAGVVIEDAIGGSGSDKISGNAVANKLSGNAGNDIINGLEGSDLLFGGLGNDTLNGGTENDLITGGTGRDVMTGGAGLDDFDFNFVSETGKTAATHDVIKDFQHLIDDIDLSGIDANGSAAGATAFKFLSLKGAAFTGVKGQLHWLQINATGTANDKTIVEGDINGDKIADFQIELTGLKALTATDFIL